jgi:hypothetical protein
LLPTKIILLIRNSTGVCGFRRVGAKSNMVFEDNNHLYPFEPIAKHATKAHSW